MTISISIFFKSVDILTIDISYRYIEQGYPCALCSWLNMVDIDIKDMDVNYERLVDVVNIDVLDAVDTNMAGYGGYRWRIWVALVSKEAEANEKSWGQDLFFSHQVLLSRLRFDWFSIYTPHDVSPPLSRLWPVIRLIGLQVPPPHSVEGEKSLGCKSSSIQAPRMA